MTDLEREVRHVLARKADQVTPIPSEPRRAAAMRRIRRRQVWTVLLAAVLLGGVTLGGYQAMRTLWPSQPADVVGESPGDGGIPSRGASGCWPDIEEVPCGPGAIEGVWYPYRVQTHCGVRHAFFDGRWWVANPPPEGVAGNAPRGWDDPSQLGRMRLIHPDEAAFMAPGGLAAEFIPARPGFEPPACF